MDRFTHTRLLFLAVFLLGLGSAGCASADPTDGGKTQTPTSDLLLLTALETQLDTSTTQQPQTDDAAPGLPEIDEALPNPQDEIPAAVPPQGNESPSPPPSDSAPAAQPQVDNPPAAPQEPDRPTPVLGEVNPSIRLTGRVWRAKPGIVFLKTPIGLMSLSSKTTLKTLPASQEVSFLIHEDHVVVDIVRRTDGALVHRYLTGPFKRDHEDRTKLMRWTPEGGERAFHMGAQERALASRKDGEPVTVEVDGTDTVIGIHDLQFDLQIGQAAANGAKAHLLLTGTISKLKSNFIFFRTPIGIVNVNAKIGIKNAKVGQTLTLRMHDHHVVADLSSSSDSAPVRRFLTGPLEFAAQDRASVRLWTPEGEQIYPADLGKSALNGAREGTPITVELDGEGDVVEFHRIK
ncbi:MAG: hypothetical protein A4E19_06490 [Nitrospira sp. SG-bin1]|nr:MAG: hypothetical protein A4E19_06490 [Nitrospira sp. SG-bin1]